MPARTVLVLATGPRAVLWLKAHVAILLLPLPLNLNLLPMPPLTPSPPPKLSSLVGKEFSLTENATHILALKSVIPSPPHPRLPSDPGSDPCLFSQGVHTHISCVSCRPRSSPALMKTLAGQEAALFRVHISFQGYKDGTSAVPGAPVCSSLILRP